MKKTLLAIAVVCILSGCASLTTAVNAYGTVAVDNAKAANDAAISAWVVAGCAMPLSAIMRNPQIIPALRAICMPQTDIVPSELLSGQELLKRK